MEPALIAGDNVLVCKLVPGPRLFNLFAAIRGEHVDIIRLPGLRSVRRNDVLVFHFPHPENWQHISMDMRKYFIKRCTALPGDTIEIVNGFTRVRGINEVIGNLAAQKRLASLDTSKLETAVLHAFPFEGGFFWNIKDFGPLYIPQKGASIDLNHMNFLLYRKIIEWELDAKLVWKDTCGYVHGKPVPRYSFKQNYYFMMGDKTENSQDSRYWGFLPEPFIVGRAVLIWKSADLYTQHFRWERFMKRVE